MKHRSAAGAMILAALCACLSVAAADEPKPTAPPRFCFLGPHLFPFEQGVAGLTPYDMNGDGKTDLVVMDPRASKFHILLQKRAGEAPKEEPSAWTEKRVNELEPDRLLAKEEVRISEPLMGYVVGGFAGSDAAIAYLTGGKELVVERKDKDGKWEVAQRFLLDLGSTFAGGFEAADLDGNGKKDLVFLAENDVLIFFQDAEGKLAEPRRHPIANEKSGGLVLGDANNDGRPDLVYISPGTRYPLQIRLTRPDGSPGPEYRFRMPAPRSVAIGPLAAGDCTGNGRNDIALIESTTNRIKLLRWQLRERATAEATETGGIELVPFPKDEKAKMRSYVIADVDGDGLPDAVVTEPGAARVSLIRSRKGAGLLPLESFPSLQETSGMAAVKAPDGRADLILCSRKEGIVGLSRFDPESGRLEYPRPVDVGGEPYAVAAAQPGSRKEAYLYCSLRGPKKRGDEKGPVELVTLERQGSGYGVAQRQFLEGLKEPPVRLLPVDADGDGLTDLLAFPEYESPLLLVQGRDGRFTDVTGAPGFRLQLLRNLKGAAVDTAVPKRSQPPAMFLGSENLVRVVRYAEGNLVVEDQFSSANPRSSYAALAAADLDGDGETEILAADYTTKWLSVLKRDEKGIYQVTRNIEIGPFEFLGLVPADLDGDGKAEVLIVGQDQLGVLFLSEGGPDLVEIATIETDQKETAYAQVAIADLNGDGRNDLLLREVRQHQLEILYRTSDDKWQRGMRFKVFEGRVLDRPEVTAPEPREVVAADVTGDGLTDIAIVCHDRVIVYPQEPAAATKD